jgi:dihydrodipicolinate synthase/N-acetylneuraminate lyase
MIVTPYYNKPTQAGVLTHFRMIADATDLPVILYDIPGRTGIPIQYETILRAAKHPNILAIKDAKGDLAQASRVLNQTGLMYFAGDDANALPTLAIGGTGLIGVTANVTATPYRTMVDAVNAGDLRAATHAHQQLEPLVRAVMTHVPGTVAAKYILHGLGRIGSPDRGRDRPRPRRARRRLPQLPPRPQRRRGRRAAEGRRHHALNRAHAPPLAGPMRPHRQLGVPCPSPSTIRPP